LENHAIDPLQNFSNACRDELRLAATPKPVPVTSLNTGSFKQA